jgi:hypothetical protein
LNHVEAGPAATGVDGRHDDDYFSEKRQALERRRRVRSVSVPKTITV